jgi:hypothetical protein
MKGGRMDRSQLLAKAQEIRSDMRRFENLLQASVVLRKTKCGTKGCRCTQGQLHSSWSVTYKEKGTTKTICISDDIREEVMQWAKNWKLFRRQLRQHNAMLLSAIRKRNTSAG